MTDAERIEALERRVDELTDHLNQVTALLTQLVTERNAAVEHYRPELEAMAKNNPPQ